MKLLVIDGQGGKLGAAIIDALVQKAPQLQILAVGTNAAATAAMRKAGAAQCATGENPVIVNCADADIIIGPIGILAADAMLGEITPAMAHAVSASRAQKVLVPVNRCNIKIAGVPDDAMLATLLQNAVHAVLAIVAAK